VISVPSRTSATTPKRSRVARRGRRVGLVAGLAALGLGLSACGPSLNLVTVPWAESQAAITSALFGDNDVSFEETPAIRVKSGRIESVTVKPAQGGESVGGSLQKGGSAWKIDTEDLDFGTKYKVTATAVDLRGKETTVKGAFKTFVPEKEVTITTNVWDGSTFGIGMPITVSFSEPVLNKAEMESKLQVSTDSKKEVVGRWSWDSDTLVTYRPKKYWPGNTKVSLDAEIKGVDAGDGAYAMDNATRDFNVGTANVMYIDDWTKLMTFRQDGKVVRSIPVSMGKPGLATRSGIKVLLSRERNVVFTADVAESDPEFYRSDIDVAMRVTWSGEYIHSAPWSVGYQGNTNVSHGCINVSPGNAEWIIQNSNVGDIVEVVNTGRPQDLGNGITVWNESWADWKEGSAL
jgi:lipoprotein-anchoring transpeptidase ErfK/SrfK